MGTPRASRSSGPRRAERAPDAATRPGRYGFPARLRLSRRGDFDRTRSEGTRVTDSRLTLWALPNGLGFSRFGVIVGHRHGGAVRRNRIKRVLREAFRLTRPELPAGLDLVCVPRVGAQLGLQAAIESLRRLAKRGARRLARRKAAPEEPSQAGSA
jgi:ribonuclease P protein component